MKISKSPGYFLAFAGIVATAFLNALVAPTNRVGAWWLSMTLTALVFLLLGWLQQKRLWGILIDENNRISLSRFQLFLWCVILLPAIATATSSRMTIPDTALDFTIPMEVWALLGISIVSATGATVLNARKIEENTIASPPAEPSWADLFRGDRKDNADVVDISRTQNVFFTVVTVWVYGTALHHLFQLPGDITTLPAVSEGMATLLGISHAGYLAGKAAPMKPVPPGVSPASVAHSVRTPSRPLQDPVPNMTVVVTGLDSERPFPEVTVRPASTQSFAQEVVSVGAGNTPTQ